MERKIVHIDMDAFFGRAVSTLAGIVSEALRFLYNHWVSEFRFLAPLPLPFPLRATATTTIATATTRIIKRAARSSS